MLTIRVRPWERALERRYGRPTRALEPGAHRRRWRAGYSWIDVRQRLLAVAPQEVLTADGVAVKVSASVLWQPGDVVRFTEVTGDPTALVYVAVQQALREAVADAEAESVSRGGRQDLVERLRVAAVRAGAPVGVEVLDVVLKDVVLPPELRAAYAAVVAGRQHALARLEAARAETAALRSLANGAKLLDEHPALARLRLVQSLPPGSTVELS